MQARRRLQVVSKYLVSDLKLRPPDDARCHIGESVLITQQMSHGLSIMTKYTRFFVRGPCHRLQRPSSAYCRQEALIYVAVDSLALTRTGNDRL